MSGDLKVGWVRKLDTEISGGKSSGWKKGVESISSE